MSLKGSGHALERVFPVYTSHIVSKKQTMYQLGQVIETTLYAAEAERKQLPPNHLSHAGFP